MTTENDRAGHRVPIGQPPYELVSDDLPDTEVGEREHMHAWSKAIMILDKSEVLTRDLIERDLVWVAGKPMSFPVLDRAAKRLMRKIKIIREEAIKTAFRQARTKIGDKSILGAALDTWARVFSKSDLDNINTAIRVGLVDGLESDEIARKVVGSMALNGMDGVTEYTRHKMGHLGRAAIREVLARKEGLPSA
jgi:hypothetical protein